MLLVWMATGVIWFIGIMLGAMLLQWACRICDAERPGEGRGFLIVLVSALLLVAIRSIITACVGWLSGIALYITIFLLCAPALIVIYKRELRVDIHKGASIYLVQLLLLAIIVGAFTMITRQTINPLPF
jgi:hypothetical protein